MMVIYHHGFTLRHQHNTTSSWTNSNAFTILMEAHHFAKHGLHTLDPSTKQFFKTWKSVSNSGLFRKDDFLRSASSDVNMGDERPFCGPSDRENDDQQWDFGKSRHHLKPQFEVSKAHGSGQIIIFHYIIWIKAIWGFPLLTMISSELVVSSL